MRAIPDRAAIMSFDPDLIEAVRHANPDLTRGIVAERHYSDPEWDQLPAAQKQSLAWLLHAPRSRPQFLAYSVQDLPAAPAAAGPHGVRAAVADLDGTQRRESQARGALGRPDHFRGLAALGRGERPRNFERFRA